MEEPTAAAVAYDLHKKKNVHHILGICTDICTTKMFLVLIVRCSIFLNHFIFYLVYDFGGGTLDVSLLYVAKGSVQVYATDGDDLLGGSDFDICVRNLISEKIAKQLDDLETSHAHVGTCFEAAYLRESAESIKKQLSFSNISQFTCESNNGLRIQFDFLRREFEEGCKYIFDRGMEPVLRLLQDLGMKPEEVDEIVLVGGTTRIPLVKSQLRSLFGSNINDQIDPDLTVAYGAASVLQ